MSGSGERAGETVAREGGDAPRLDSHAWLAQQMSQTQVTRLMRIGWESVGKVLERVVADFLDQGRLNGLVFIGVDEINYGADHKFLTCVADHQRPRIVPDARVCFDPFHVVRLGTKAADQVHEYNEHGRSGTEQGKWIKGTRYSLLKDTANQTAKQLLKLAEVVTTNKRMYSQRAQSGAAADRARRLTLRSDAAAADPISLRWCSIAPRLR